MKYINWDVPLSGMWLRGTELVKLEFEGSSLSVTLLEEDTEKPWRFLFKNVQAFRKTTQECARFVISSDLADKPFMKVEKSDWIKNLGSEHLRFLGDTNHFVIFTYDDLIEVAAWECSISPISK